MKSEVLAVILVLLLVGGLGLGLLVGESSSTPSSVHITGTVSALYYNTTSAYSPSRTFIPSSLQFVYYLCNNFATAACASQYNATITSGIYSVTVPNGHLYYVVLGHSNVAGGCFFGGSMSVPIYSYASTMNYNVSSICYSIPT